MPESLGSQARILKTERVGTKMMKFRKADLSPKSPLEEMGVKETRTEALTVPARLLEANSVPGTRLMILALRILSRPRVVRA